MSQEGRQLHLNALNRAFEKAFSHTASRETLLDLLSCMGEELGCDRISIFELNMDRTCDNTYEWCSPGKTHLRELMQSIPLSTFDDWMEILSRQEFICIRDLESVRVNEPDVYALFHAQQVNAVIVARLAFHGRDIGFFILENPDEETLGEAESVLPGMRYILSSLVYSDHLLRKLERMGYLDHLTNTGNRLGLQECFDRLDPDRSLGLIFCEVLGWKQNDHRLTEIQEEQALIRTGEILSGLFDEEHTFRIAPDEFLALIPETDRESVDFQVHSLRHLLDEHDLLAAVGSVYTDRVGNCHDGLVRQAHLMAHNEIRALTLGREQAGNTVEAAGDNDLAHIPLYRMDAFFRQAPKHFSDFYDEALLTVVVDVNYFRLYNDIFGRKAGNHLLEQLAENLRLFTGERLGIAGYLGGDNFIAVIPTREKSEEKLGPLLEEMARALRCPEGFPPVLGAYLSTDRQETLVAMYDHALTALKDIKGSYVDTYRFYDVEHYRRERDS
ncbi:MAG: diguanylate cyclase [Clostridia bacterium]|nr:diguanylate cyclase [Clostridia bacterium]